MTADDRRLLELLAESEDGCTDDALLVAYEEALYENKETPPKRGFKGCT